VYALRLEGSALLLDTDQTGPGNSTLARRSSTTISRATFAGRRKRLPSTWIWEGVFVNATLMQLTNRVIMEPDPKAVSFLPAPKETRHPRSGPTGRRNRRSPLSSHTQYETNSGVFELRFDSERFLSFEGTGAVSRWRLELGGPPGSYDLRHLTDANNNESLLRAREGECDDETL
jgi:hypothetical protein